MGSLTATNINQEIQSLIRYSAMPIEPGESVKAQQRKVALRLRHPFGRVRKLWYGEARNIPAHEYLTLKERYSRWLAEREAQLTRDLEALRNDLNDLR